MGPVPDITLNIVFLFIFPGCKRAVVRDTVGQPQHPASAGRHWRLPEAVAKAAQGSATNGCWACARGKDEGIPWLPAPLCWPEAWSAERKALERTHGQNRPEIWYEPWDFHFGQHLCYGVAPIPRNHQWDCHMCQQRNGHWKGQSDRACFFWIAWMICSMFIFQLSYISLYFSSQNNGWSVKVKSHIFHWPFWDAKI